MIPSPNATPAPTVIDDPLTFAHARMARAAFVVLADAADADMRGEDIGIFRDVLHHHRCLVPFARDVRDGREVSRVA